MPGRLVRRRSKSPAAVVQAGTSNIDSSIIHSLAFSMMDRRWRRARMTHFVRVSTGRRGVQHQLSILSLSLSVSLFLSLGLFDHLVPSLPFFFLFHTFSLSLSLSFSLPFLFLLLLICFALLSFSFAKEPIGNYAKQGETQWVNKKEREREREKEGRGSKRRTACNHGVLLHEYP